MKTTTHNSIDLAKKFREIFNKKFDNAVDEGKESFIIKIKDFDLFLTSLDSFPKEEKEGIELPPSIPDPGTAEHHRFINFRNQIRKNINNAARVGSHIDDNGYGHPPYEIRVYYRKGPKYVRGAKKGINKRIKDAANYQVRLLSATVRVLHTEVAETLHKYAVNKVHYLSKMNQYIKEHLQELPPEVQLAHKLRGRRTEKTISFAAQMISDDIRETQEEYQEVVALIGDGSPPISRSQMLPMPASEEAAGE